MCIARVAPRHDTGDRAPALWGVGDTGQLGAPRKRLAQANRGAILPKLVLCRLAGELTSREQLGRLIAA